LEANQPKCIRWKNENICFLEFGNFDKALLIVKLIALIANNNYFHSRQLIRIKF